MHIRGYTVLLLSLLAMLSGASYGQGNKKRLPRVINIPDKDATAPQISADGRHLYYLTNNNLNDQFELWRARKRGGSWGNPEPTKVPIQIDQAIGRRVAEDVPT